MKLALTPSFELSDEHSASSYGQPVLVNRSSGEAFGPGDVLEPYPSWSFMLASQAVRRMAGTVSLNKRQVGFVKRFTG